MYLSVVVEKIGRHVVSDEPLLRLHNDVCRWLVSSANVRRPNSHSHTRIDLRSSVKLEHRLQVASFADDLPSAQWDFLKTKFRKFVSNIILFLFLIKKNNCHKLTLLPLFVNLTKRPCGSVSLISMSPFDEPVMLKSEVLYSSLSSSNVRFLFPPLTGVWRDGVLRLPANDAPGDCMGVMFNLWRKIIIIIQWTKTKI